MHLRDLIRQHGTSEDPAQAARAVIDVLLRDHQDLAAGLLFNIVRDEIRRSRRELARSQEKYAARAGAEAAARSGGDPRFEALRLLRKNAFLDPLTKTMVTWGSATADQHMAYADELLDTIVLPTRLNVERHRYAAKAITSAGAGCLAEVPGYLDD